MLKHNLLITFRNANRHKSSFLINLVGLSVGLACVLLISLWINDELRVDRFNENDERLYQVWQNVPRGSGDILTTQATPAVLAKALLDEFPEIEDATISMNHWSGIEGIVTTGINHFKAKEYFVDSNFFEIFSFDLLSGNEASVLSDKYSVVLSEELAIKLFQSAENSVGQTIEWSDGAYRGIYSGLYTVTGVFKAPPKNSSLQFDLLFTFDRFLEERDWLNSWANSDPNTYVLLKEGADLDRVNTKIKDYRKTKYQQFEGTEHLDGIGTLFLQRFSDNYLFNRFENGQSAGGRIEYVKLFSLIALLVIVIACINFINLSIAKASLRMKEIGIKKAIGIDRKRLVFQFLSESVFLTFISGVVAVLLLYTLLPEFNQITGKEISLHFNPEFAGYLLAIVVITGLISGSYPALFLSGQQPVSILKGKLTSSLAVEWTQKGLVVFQFTVSIILIISVLAVYKQIDLVQTKNLGYNKENVITFKREGRLNESLETFLAEVKQYPGVSAASSFAHNLTGSHGGLRGISWEGENSDSELHFANLEVGYDLLELMGIEMVAGRSFSRDFGADSSRVIFNEAAIAAMGIENPIGKRIQLRHREFQIVGVAKDFHFDSLYESIGPGIIQLNPNNRNILIKLRAGGEEETVNRIADLYEEFSPGLQFEYRFLEEEYQALYESEHRVGVLSRYFALLAIVISCLGLFALSVFKAERRRKEVTIRKVLGASLFSLLRLLSEDFTKLVGLALLIAIPIGYHIVDMWLDNFAYHAEIPWWYFGGAGIAALVIAYLTVSVQTLRVATANPVDWLKEE
ncbi:MAG: ABC transporter permease [Rhodothermales bacterium]